MSPASSSMRSSPIESATGRAASSIRGSTRAVTRTSGSRSSSAATRRRPMNPGNPVTSSVIAAAYCGRPVIDAAIFDLDGLLVDSESVWDEARRQYVAEHGGAWRAAATEEMMGMSSVEWSRYVRDQLGVDRPPETISEEVAGRVSELYRERLPLVPGARDAV